ncbi:MAG: DUF2244 domain-containing protein [Pseudomonadota bacterium]
MGELQSDIDDAAKNQSGQPEFSALLVPHRSMTPGGFAVLMAVFIAICGSNAAFYYFMGAWPVAIFMVIDVLILYTAIKLSYRAGRRSEEVILSRTGLTVKKVEPNGRQRQHTFNTIFARFHIDRDNEFGITRMQIRGEGVTSTIGSFLNPDDKESFAKAFQSALATAKR